MDIQGMLQENLFMVDELSKKIKARFLNKTIVAKWIHTSTVFFRPKRRTCPLENG